MRNPACAQVTNKANIVSFKTPLLGEGPTHFVQNPTVGTMTYPFHSSWEKGPPRSFKTPLLAEDLIHFVQTILLEEGPYPFRWKPHCWEKGLPLSFKTPLLGESIPLFKTPLLGEGPTPFVMFATFLHRLVSGVFDENINIFNFRIVLLVGTLKDFNFFCSIFST